MTKYRILDSTGHRYLDILGVGTVIPSGQITTTDLRRVGMYAHLGIRTFLIESTQDRNVAWHVSERGSRFHDVDGWKGFTIHRADADTWDEAKGYGSVRSG